MNTIMKKIVFLMGIAAVAFASCAKDSVSEANLGKAIDFRVATNTRATETTTDNLTCFKVTALTADEQASNYFTDVTFNEEGSFYSSAPDFYYWPNTGSLNFYAYSPVNLSGVSVTKAGKTVTDFTPATTVADQVDFITATATGSKANETTGVALNFTHELTQVLVKVKNANKAYTYTVKAFKIGNVVGKGTFDFTKAVGQRWSLSNESIDVTSYEVSFATGTVLPADGTPVSFMDETTASGSAMLLPQQLTAWTKDATAGTYFAVLAKVQTSTGTVVHPTNTTDEYGWLAVGVDTEWKAGYKYVYTLDFTTGAGTPVTPEGEGTGGEGEGEGELFGGKIQFTATVTPWTSADAITLEKEVTVEEGTDEENGETNDENTQA